MLKYYVLYIVAFVSLATGAIGFFLISWSPVPVYMAVLGVFAYWVIPVLPSMILAFVGFQVCLCYKHAPLKLRFAATGCLALMLLGVWTSMYILATSKLPVRHVAFDWGFYLTPLCFVVYRVERYLFMRYGE
jgi:hypothetical protein